MGNLSRQLHDTDDNPAISHQIRRDGIPSYCHHLVRRWLCQRRDSPFAKGLHLAYPPGYRSDRPHRNGQEQETAKFKLCEPATDRTSLLWPEVQRGILHGLVMLAESPLLCLVDDCQHSCNVLPHHLDLGELRCCTASHLGDPEGGKLVLELLKLLVEVSLALALLAKLVALYLSHCGAAGLPM